MARRGYTLLLWLLLPWVVLHLLSRSRRQPEYRCHWGERFGRYGARRPAPCIWIHAVSVGETRAAQPLVAALKRWYPDRRILLTHMTPTGRRVGEELFGTTVDQAYLAYDYPHAVGRFLAHWQPAFGVIATHSQHVRYRSARRTWLFQYASGPAMRQVEWASPCGRPVRPK